MAIRNVKRKPASERNSFAPATLEKVFSDKVFLQLAADLKSGRVPVPRQTLTKDGLQVIIRDTGTISYLVIYNSGNTRTTLTLGSHDEGMRLAEARYLADTIRALSDKGIDVQAGLHKRLIRELKEQGTKWRP